MSCDHFIIVIFFNSSKKIRAVQSQTNTKETKIEMLDLDHFHGNELIIKEYIIYVFSNKYINFRTNILKIITL